MTTETRPALDGVHHLKYPVSDLDTSLEWWEKAFAAERQAQWDHRTPDGLLFAYMLQVPGLEPPLELRLAPGSAEAMAGYDPIVFAAADHASLVDWVRHFDALGLENSGVLRGLIGWMAVVKDPDGSPIRLYTRETHEWDPARADFGSPWAAPLERDRL
jgi:catechol 2,3-dioxygenase-like lactoylglutathione lyase family enzyme